MVKALIAVLGLAFSMNAVAAPSAVETIATIQNAAIMDQAYTNGFGLESWATLLTTTSTWVSSKELWICRIRSVAADGIWMDQNMDLGFAGKQKVEITIDPNHG